ncbi:response regulator [Agrobacterium tumefaciens]|uniref:response regulator n=1 Tax=Agrobacterium tumefaciens TaxID=358 RepID=UPI0021D0EF01|nr:response regulator [Agrobacterium tumefaciens]UXS01367.1 response regulator [Agrobacterium tumefaciens]
MPMSAPKILVVEDEPLLRMAAVDMIEAEGFEAIEAADATEAIAILETRPDITIVFTDIDMPRGMDGMKLAALIRDRWPPIHLIITSGHMTPARTSLPENSVFFSKPYRERDVIAQMRRMAA